METKVNSFTETVSALVNQVNISLEYLTKLSTSVTTQEDTVTLYVEVPDDITGDPSTKTYSLPSYNKILNEVNAMKNAIDVFTNGTGKILRNDGTYREVITIPIATSPIQITNVTAPTKFTIRSNWFFESLMVPQLIVSFNLKNKIDDRSDRVVVKRVIFDNPSDEETQWFLDNIVGTERTYYNTITYLNNNGKKYWEDEEVQDLPLATEPYTGYFIITNIQTVNSKQWYYLDSINYGIPSDSPVIKNYQLTVNDQLRFGNNIFKIDDIVASEQRVHLIPVIGIGNPTINGQFEIYSTPFSTKMLNIPVGYNECNIIFLKGVNDDFNIIGDDWSYNIPFYSNYLTYENTSTTLEEYYIRTVSDFGIQLEGQVKEKFIPAFFGIIPDAPIIASNFFKVVQINTQLNAALDITIIKDTQTQIESTKTIINSLKTTISSQKAELVSLTDPAARTDLQSKIDSNNSNLSKLTIEYQSLERSLATVAYENSAVLADPKYRIRGFFPIPQSKGNPQQQIIQFEYAYRYLRLDNTGNPLNTFQYSDPSTSQIVKGVYTDWIIIPSTIKQKTYDVSSGIYYWTTENISDGEAVNINQVDIPIQKGEKVELKIRSISEAGWPLNPLKSVWSETIIIEFPSNLEGSNQIINILANAGTEQQAIALDETLSAAGVPTHIADSVPNPNSGTGTYFKHQAVNLAYDLKTKNKDGVITEINTTDLQTQLTDLTSYSYITLSRPAGALDGHLQVTGTIQQFFQAIIDASGKIYDNFAGLIP